MEKKINFDLLAATLAYIEPRKEEFASEFYGKLFADYHDAYLLFTGRHVDMESQKRLLMATLYGLVKVARSGDMNTAKGMVVQLGRRHKSYGAPVEFYTPVGITLIYTFKNFMGPAWTPLAEESWLNLYELVSSTMTESYR